MKPDHTAEVSMGFGGTPKKARKARDGGGALGTGCTELANWMGSGYSIGRRRQWRSFSRGCLGKTALKPGET